MNGFQNVNVPEGPSAQNVISGGISSASAGASIGGPWGAAAGAVIGIGQGIIQNKKMKKAKKNAIAHNEYMEANRAYDGVDPTEFQAEQRYPNGTQGIAAASVGDYNNFTASANTGRVDPNGNQILDFNPVARKDGENQRTFVKAADGTTYRVWGNRKVVNDAKMKLNPPAPATKIEPVVTGAGFKIPVPLLAEGSEYMNGTKQIEVERDELIFQKDKLGQFKLKADFQGGKKHAQGGEDYVAQEGDIIFPGKLRKKVLDAFNKKNYTALESMRMKLPRDTNSEGQALKGIGGVLGDMDEMLARPNVEGGPTIAPSVSSPGINLNGVLGAAGVANNMIQSFAKPEKVNREFYKPSNLKYTDRSDPLRAQSKSVAAIDSKNARNLSAGNAGNARANMAQAKAADFIRQQGIDNQEQGRADQVQNYNIESQNRAKQFNTQLAGRYDEMQAANNAAPGAYRNEAMEGISQLAQVAEQKKYMMSRDAKADKMDESALAAYNDVFPNYMWDPKEGKVKFK